MSAVTYFDTMATPLGELMFTSDGDALTGLSVEDTPAEESVRS